MGIQSVIVHCISNGNHVAILYVVAGRFVCMQSHLREDGMPTVTAKMVHVTELPHEVLSIIFTFLAMSGDGLRDLARVSATCQLFNSCSTDEDFLRKLTFNFQNVRLDGRCEIHHHTNDLLSRCVRVGNASAECALAMGGTWLWSMILENELTNSSIKCATTLSLSDTRNIAKSLITDSVADLPYILFSLEDAPSDHESYARLQHTRLIKSFIQNANIWDLIEMRHVLIEFVEFYVGYERFSESRIFDTMVWMTFCECMEDPARRLNDPYSVVTYEVVRVPVGSTSYRDQLILAYDNLLG